MHPSLALEDLVGGASMDPTLPNIISFDIAAAINTLNLYTNNLKDLAAPSELCIQKALEIINDLSHYELNLASFRMELVNMMMEDFPNNKDSNEVDALMNGIHYLCEYLIEQMAIYRAGEKRFFAYEYYNLHKDRYLFLVKIVFDADQPTVRPANIVLPGYTYPEVHQNHGAYHLTETY